MLHKYVVLLVVSLGFIGSCANDAFGQHIKYLLPDSSKAVLESSNIPEWDYKYPHYRGADSNLYNTTILIAPSEEQLIVGVVRPTSLAELNWEVSGGELSRIKALPASDTIWLILTPDEEHVELSGFRNDSLLTKLQIKRYSSIRSYLTVVPLGSVDLDSDSLHKFLNNCFKISALDINLTVEESFKLEGLEGTWPNPTPDRDHYTDEMIHVRDSYFDLNPKKRGYYIFLMNGFVNDSIEEYIVRNKGVGFVNMNGDNPFRAITRNLAIGLGGLNETYNEGIEKGSTNNLLDDGDGVELCFFQAQQIRKYYHTHPYYDDYEDVRTRGGQVAYYFWEEDKEGNIKLSGNNFLSALKRPIKRNQFTYLLNIDNFFFQPLFEIYGIEFNPLHLIVWVLLIAIFFFLRKKVIKVLARRVWVIRLPVKMTLVLLFFAVCIEGFFLVNYGYAWFEIKTGEIAEFKGESIRNVISKVRNNNQSPVISTKKPKSQVMIKKGDKWEVSRMKNVLYFDCYQGDKFRMRFSHSSDELKVPEYNGKSKVRGHLYVLKIHDEDGNLIEWRVYNHSGTNVGEKMDLPDPARRILLFVNGYRPTSQGKTFGESLNEITERGLEFPNSSNLIYEFDRYDYWHPWRKIDTKFENRINPSETYYADGHFTVETSNHRSLVEFTTLSASYPKPCHGKHTCTKQKTRGLFGTRRSNPSLLFDTRPNKSGFEERRRNGRVAGKNLLQMLNEIPNGSDNDTLFIVAHSMGYAYALGIIDEVRGKISFGDFIIVAPENASAGSVNQEEWMNVWQYGSDFDKLRTNTPCLLDGVAPQTIAGGLGRRQFVGIPDGVKQGFFDSHFIGYYTWIFDIPKEQKGYIPQR